MQQAPNSREVLELVLGVEVEIVLELLKSLVGLGLASSSVVVELVVEVVLELVVGFVVEVVLELVVELDVVELVVEDVVELVVELVLELVVDTTHVSLSHSVPIPRNDPVQLWHMFSFSSLQYPCIQQAPSVGHVLYGSQSTPK